jgi:hypothetical protein
MTTPKFSNPDVRRIVKAAVKRGWACEKKGNGPHPYRLISPVTRTFIPVYGTPSGTGLFNFRDAVRKTDAVEATIPVGVSIEDLATYKQQIQASLSGSSQETGWTGASTATKPKIKAKKAALKTPPPEATEENPVADMLEDMAKWSKHGFELYGKIDDAVGKLRENIAYIDRRISMLQDARKSAVADIDKFAALEKWVEIQTAPRSEPHVVSEPSTEAEVMASDNKVIKDAFQAAPKNVPDVSVAKSDKHLPPPQEFKHIDREDNLARAIGGYLWQITPRATRFPKGRAEVLCLLYQRKRIPKVNKIKGDRGLENYWYVGCSTLRKDGFIQGKRTNKGKLSLTSEGRRIIKEALAHYGVVGMAS